VALPTTAERRASGALTVTTTANERTATPIAMITISVITTPTKVAA
jgi:hypothetical protein